MRVNYIEPTMAEIGDPFAAAARVRALRQKMFSPQPEPIKIVAPKESAPQPSPRVNGRTDVLFIDEFIIFNGKVTTFNPAYMPPGGTWFEEQKLRGEGFTNYQAMAQGRTILAQVAKERGVTCADIVSARRDRKIVEARHEAIWRVKKCTILSYPKIGQLFNRDHSTCIAAYQVTEARKAKQVAAACEHMRAHGLTVLVVTDRRLDAAVVVDAVARHMTEQGVERRAGDLMALG